MLASLVTGAFKLGSDLITRLIPDKAQQAEAHLELVRLHQSGALQEMISAAGVIKAEAESEHVITATWRPIVMLFLTGCVGAYWFGYTAPNLSEEAIIELLAIVKFGLGGYVLGRSAEKTAKAWKSNG